MNKKQLAKLLIKHPEIKALYESQEFDASTINKIVAEEIMREDEDEEGEGRVSKAANQARAALDAEDSVFNLDPSLSDAEIRKQFRAALKSAATLEQIGALGKEASEILDPKYARTLEKDIKAAKARIEGGSTNDSKEDSAKKKLIQSMKSEIEFLKTLLSDPNEMPLDKEEYKEAIDEYIEKLEKMGVEVAKTDSIEDDKAFVKSVADSKPEIEKAADAVKAAGDDEFAEKFSDLDAAIMAALKGSKDAATATNDELDLSDIEIEDDGSDNPAGSGFKIDNSSSPELTRDSYDNQIIGMKDAIPEEDKKQFIKDLKSESPNPAIERILGSNKGYLEMFNDQQHVENILKVFEPDQQMELPAGNEQPATEEGTAAAVEAIVDEVPVEVANIQPADVQAAEEELETEIEASPEKQARAEELTNKVENNKMAPEKKMKALEGVAQINDAFKKAQDDIKSRIAASTSGAEGDMENLPKTEEILSGPIKAMEETITKIFSANSWEELAGAGIWPRAIESRRKTDELPEFDKWKEENSAAMNDKFKELRDSLGKINISGENAIDELVDVMGDAAVTIGTAIENSDASDNDIDGDSSGAEVTGATDLETIKKILPELKDQFPNLFKFDEFVKNLAQALMKTEPSSDSDGEEEGQVDATGTASSSEVPYVDSNVSSNSLNIPADSKGLGESLSGIYLTEETEVNDTQVDNTADDTIGQPVSVEDATILKTELEELRKILEPKKINVEELLPQDLRDALAKAPETDVEVEPKTTKEAAEDGNTASETDAQKEQASAIEIYSALIQPMDDFFSTDQAQRLGFMEQFLLESQSKMLWNLIGNLTLIAEKGKAKAFTNRAEKEAAGMSGDGAPEAEVEQTAEPEVQAEAQFNPFKRDKEPVEISKEDQISLKTDLKALLQTLRATKSMIGSYERNMTKVSVDPGLDGSALKEQLDQYLPMVQKSIAKIVERANEAFIKATELNAPKEKPEASQPADDAQPSPTPPTEPEATQEGMINAIFEAMQPALHEMSLMQEESRDETINRVDSVYKDMRLIYAPVGDGEDSEGLRGFMETGNRERTIQQAEKMLELATKEDFIKLFPGGRIGEGGMPATVNAATETMNREIKKLVLIMRDVVTLASKSVIPHSKLVEIVNSLTTISKSLYNSFGAKMMISGESLAQIETRLGEDASNKSLTDQETKPGMMDKLGNLAGKAGELAGKGLEKLKQMFSWMSNETRKLLLKFFGEDSELIDGLSSSDLSEEQQEALVEDIVESKTWYQNLEQDAKSAVDALVKYLINEVGRDSLKQLNYPAVVSEKLNDDERRTISNFAQETQETFGKELSNRTYKFLHAADEDIKVSSMKLMVEETDDLVSYLTTIFKIVDKISKEAAEEMVSPQTATVTQGDQDPNVEDGMPEPENLGKDNSELEDVDGFDDSKEEPDISGSPEDEDDVEDFKREVKSLDSFLPLVQKPTDPIAKKIQPIKDSFTSTLAKKKILQGPRAKELFNKFFLLIFKQMNKDLVMEDTKRFAKTLIPKIKQDMKKFVTSLGSDELKPRDFNFFFNNIKEVDLTNLIAIIRKHKAQIAKIVYGEKGQVTQDNSEKAVRGKEVTLQEALRPIIEKMLNEHYNH